MCARVWSGACVYMCLGVGHVCTCLCVRVCIHASA